MALYPAYSKYCMSVEKGEPMAGTVHPQQRCGASPGIDGAKGERVQASVPDA
jgi:hypothetical protein